MTKGREIQERVFRFACDVVRLHDVLASGGGSARDMSRQLMRAAMKEGRESLYWLRLLRATGKVNETADPLLHECDRIVAVLTTIVKKAKGDA